MNFCLLNSNSFPCPRTHKLHLIKFSTGFVQNGANFLELVSDDSLTHLRENDVVYISNHFSVEPLHRPFKKRLEKKLIVLLRKTKCQFIFWNFHTTSCFSSWQEFENRAIHLGENLSEKYITQEKLLIEFRERFSVHKLRYSSPYEEVNINNGPRDFDFQFIGSRYQTKILEHVKQKYRALIRFAPPIVDEVFRVNSFHNSLVNLVFHSTANVEKGIVVERFPEALSLGGIIFHDHPEIDKEFKHLDSVFYTPNVAEVDSSFEQLKSLSSNDVTELRHISRNAWEISELTYKKQARKTLELLGRK